MQDYHKNKPIHRAESPDEAQFRSRAHTTANTSRSLHRRGIGYSQLPDAKRDQLDVNCKCDEKSHHIEILYVAMYITTH